MTMNRLHKVWKRILSLSLVLMLILTTGCLSAAAEASKKNLTVMYYICGADLERDNGQFSALMGEVMATRYNQDAVNAVGLLGGTPRWAGRAFDPSVLNIVEIAGRRPTKVDEMPLAPMSDSATLTKFMDYCQEHYPAEHYILVICDHGGGPLLGCCVDHLFEKSSLSLAGLSKSLADSVFANRGLDTIAFNACLMGSAEIANCLAPFAQYMVATEDAMYGIANDWLKDVEKDATPLETARRKDHHRTAEGQRAELRFRDRPADDGDSGYSPVGLLRRHARAGCLHLYRGVQPSPGRGGLRRAGKRRQLPV